MHVGIGIPDTESSRVLGQLGPELKSHHEVEVYKYRGFKPPIFYYRIDPYLRRYDLRQFLKRNDVVYFEWASDLLALATKLPKTCPIVVRLHRYEMFQWIPKINWDSVDKVILLSKAMRRKFVERCPGHEHKIVVIPWAVSLERFQPGSHKFNNNITTLCELIPRKRIYELILAFEQLTKSMPELSLHIGGDTHPIHLDYSDAMHVLIQRLNLQEKVFFHGGVTDVPKWLHQMDIFISNSYSEGLQSALLEAMASGCYCLSHWWDGADEVLPEEHLFFGERELQEKLLWYLELSEEDKKAHKMNLRNIVSEKFDATRINAQIRNVIEQTVH